MGEGSLENNDALGAQHMQNSVLQRVPSREPKLATHHAKGSPLEASPHQLDSDKHKASPVDENGLNDDDDDDDNDDDDSDDEGNELYKGLSQLLEQSPDDKSCESYEAFAESYSPKVKRFVTRSLKKPQTPLFNYLLSNETRKSERFKHYRFRHLVRLILEVGNKHERSLLTQKTPRTDGANTCLHLAARSPPDIEFLEAICETANPAVLCKAMAEGNRTDETCLHTAILSNTDHKLAVIELLIMKAGPEIFLKKRHSTDYPWDEKNEGAGNTPLHDFVHFRFTKVSTRTCPLSAMECNTCRKKKQMPEDIAQISQEQRRVYLKILKMFIKRSSAVVHALNDQELSPYLFHVATRETWPPGKDLEFTELIQRKEKPLEAKPQNEKVKAVESKRRDDNREPVDGRKGLVASSSSSKQSPRHIRPKLDYSIPLATETAQFLLGHSLSQETFEDACASLFGKSLPSSKLIFKAAGPLSDKTTSSHEGLDLKPILACVELGLVEQPSLRGVTSDLGLVEPVTIPEWKIKARKDRMDRLGKFFEWLRTKKRVKRILKLIIKDDPELPCSDEIIEKCLENFDVRYLDWNKDDIDIQCLQSKAASLRELWLSWSGRNSTLIAWASKDYGLPSLKQLRVVYISAKRDLESEDRTTANLIKFKNILESVAPQIKYTDIDDDKARPAVSTSNNKGDKEGDIWLTAIDDFVKAIKKKVSEEDRKKAKPIKVAIIDDGVTLEDLSMKSVVNGWFPDMPTPPHRNMNTCYVSETGHGTEMAKLIQRVCPFVGFFIAKLDTRQPTREAVYESVAESAVIAIDKAINDKVQIICMSWTIYETNSGKNQSFLKDLEDVLHKAASRGILLYCSGEDKGQYENSERPFPASISSKKIKKVGSAGTYGEKSKFVNIENVDYLLPGEIAISDEQVERGSSAATALASGLAALILWCAEVHQVTQKQTETLARTPNQSQLQVDFDFLKDGRMNALFDALKTPSKLVNIVQILKNARKNTKDKDLAGELVKLCKKTVPQHLWREMSI